MISLVTFCVIGKKKKNEIHFQILKPKNFFHLCLYLCLKTSVGFAHKQLRAFSNLTRYSASATQKKV